MLLAIAFAVTAIRLSSTRQFNTEDGWRAMAVARAVAAGRARWGLVDYTHHPMASAYALVPVLRMGRPDLMEEVPGYAGALATDGSLAVLLYLAPWPLWPGILAAFGALLWQPGYLDWLHNTWQHSWNLSIVFVLIALGCAVVRAAPWLVLVGYVGGWIGYDFIFVQIATLVAVRLAFWSQLAPARALLAVTDETLAFGTGFALAILSHLVQNTLYFSSAGIAVADLLGGIVVRVNNSDRDVATLATRWTLLREISGDYLHRFVQPTWSHWSSLAAAGAAAIAGVLIAWHRVRHTRRVGGPLAAVAAAAIGGVLAWWLIVPGHAIPHLHFFPRMLLAPLLAMLAGAVRILSVAAPPAEMRWRWRWRHLLIVLTIVALQPRLLYRVARNADQKVYTHVWATTDSAPRSDRIRAPFLPATSPQAPGPVRLKRGEALVGGVNTWALNLDNAAWKPASGQPWVYDAFFAERAAVSDVVLRFPGPPRPAGTLHAFTIKLFGATTATVLNERSANVEITELGHLRAFRYHLDPPVVAAGMRLRIQAAENAPIVTDLLAFGHPLTK